LINGIFGIVIGRRIEVPHHSLNDVIDATIAVLHDPKAKVVLIPDPCQKCEIIDTDW
jgi:DNA gyrase/topoisomerase IV subunit A